MFLNSFASTSRNFTKKSSWKQNMATDAGSMIDALLLIHVLAGVACIIAAVWVFVDTLNASQSNQARIQRVSMVSAICMWISFIVGGYWYVVFYPSDKSVILKGPWPSAHEYFMETKEHL